MQSYFDMTREELSAEQENLMKKYKEYQSRNLKLDMSRGKPSTEQLDLSMGLLNALDAESAMQTENGTDTCPTVFPRRRN